VLKDVLEEAHGGEHFGIVKTVQELKGFCIPRLAMKIKDFIKHCPSCLVNSTLRTQPNGELLPIRTVPRPFHTITMDFILALPEIDAVSPWLLDRYDTFNCLMTNTCKFSHKTLLIPGHDTYTAEDWASILVRMCFSHPGAFQRSLSQIGFQSWFQLSGEKCSR
jgi:hypothetical protein